MRKLADSAVASVGGAEPPQAEQQGWAAPATSTRWAQRLRGLVASRESARVRQLPSLQAIEEETAVRLYGERTGTVNASPASCPIEPDVAREEI